MAARDIYNSTQAAASTTKAATVANAELTRQEAVNAIGVNVGSNPQNGASASQVATTIAANTAKANTLYAAEVARQAALAVARDTLRATGDVGPL